MSDCPGAFVWRLVSGGIDRGANVWKQTQTYTHNTHISSNKPISSFKEFRYHNPTRSRGKVAIKMERDTMCERGRGL